MKTHDPADFLRMLAPHIIAEFRPLSELQKFTRNPAVVGVYVEAAIRELIRQQVFPEVRHFKRTLHRAGR